MSEPNEENTAGLGLAPGKFVRHKTESDWGLGQIQSVTPLRITVNFENRGKVVLVDQALLEPADPTTNA